MNNISAFLGLVSILVVSGQNCAAQSGTMEIKVDLVKTSENDIREDILSIREYKSSKEREVIDPQQTSADRVTLGLVKIDASKSSESLLHLQDKGIQFHVIPSGSENTIVCRFVFYTDTGGRKLTYPYSFSLDAGKTYSLIYRISQDAVFVLYIEPVKS